VAGPPKWFSAGNISKGFFAIGNFSFGVIAIGNVAIGIIAGGNLAIGVFAFGTLGLGMWLSAGVLSVGIVVIGAVVSLPVLSTLESSIISIIDFSPWLGLAPILPWGIASLIIWRCKLRKNPFKVDETTPTTTTTTTTTSSITPSLTSIPVDGTIDPLLFLNGSTTSGRIRGIFAGYTIVTVKETTSEAIVFNAGTRNAFTQMNLHFDQNMKTWINQLGIIQNDEVIVMLQKEGEFNLCTSMEKVVNPQIVQNQQNNRRRYEVNNQRIKLFWTDRSYMYWLFVWLWLFSILCAVVLVVLKGTGFIPYFGTSSISSTPSP